MIDVRKPIFDAVKNAAGRNVFNDAGNIHALNNLLDAFGVPHENSDGWRAKAIALMHEFEGCRLTAYPDPGTGGSPWTIGWGSTTDEQGKPIQPGTTWTQERADARFEQDVERFAGKVRAVLGDAPATTSQFAALVSFAYNVGWTALRDSTLLKKHKAGDYAGAKAEFARWNKAGGRVLPGLTRRRAAEAEVYSS
jgi:GH24 family phage-related lysozyme (muramidase)